MVNGQVVDAYSAIDCVCVFDVPNLYNIDRYVMYNLLLFRCIL